MSTTTKQLYTGASALTVTALASLAADSNTLAGWQSAKIDNSTVLADDDNMSGTITTGTSPTAGGTVEIWAYANLDDTPNFPDTITGTQGTVTLTSLNTKQSALALIQVITVDATTNRAYSWRGWIGQALGGPLPKYYGVWIVNNTGVALKSSGQSVISNPIQYQNV